MDLNTLHNAVPNLDKLMEKVGDLASDIAIRIALAIVIYIVGSFIIRKFIKAIEKMKSFKSVDTTAAIFIINSVKIVLYIVLGVSIVALLGVPMSSVIALLASAGVAIGLAMQGSLANIAGGIMLLVFRPFVVGDYILAGTEEGTVRSINLMYTVLTTVDNRRVSVPNGSLMNTSISNATAEPLRRVDLRFEIAAAEPVDKVEAAITGAVKNCKKALEKPVAQVLPFEPVTDGLVYVVRVWVNTKDYWDVHNELMRSVPAALNEAGIARPAQQVKVIKG